MSYVFFVTRRVRLFRLPPKPSPISACILRYLSAAVPSTSPEPKPSLSARLSLVFDQIDALERQRDIAAKDEALQRIRAWRQTKDPITPHSPSPSSVPVTAINGGSGLGDAQVTDDKDLSNFGMRDIFRREVEVVHPWPEWIELLERLAGQNYFDYRRVEEEHIAANVGIDLSGVRDEVGLDLSRDWAAVRTACMNFGRDRFDILKSLSRKDIQTLVGHGCPSMDPKVVFSAKLLRKYVHVDEGDVCSSCSLRNTCSRGYLLVPKEDEARTLDVMRILLTYAFDHIKESIANAPLRKMKTVKTVVRKLLHEVVKLSAVPRDPNLLPPAIKKPPPKVKQPPPQPKRRVGRDDVEMKKGDWLCTKCDFMNFAKNTVCLQCDAKRPKRQLLPGEWECPKCNFLNYRRNMSCFQCEHTRPPDEFTENQMQGKRIGPTTRLQRAANTSDVSNAWNLAFDDDESDGADVAAFEFADSSKARDGSFNEVSRGGSVREIEGDDGMQNLEGGRYFSTPRKGGFSSDSHATGFDDFDDEEDGVDSYELDKTDGKGTRLVSQNCLSEFDDDSGLENCDDVDDYVISKQSGKDYLSNSEDDDIRVTSQKIEDSRRQFKFGDEDLSGSNHDMRDNRGSKGQKVGRRNIGVKGSLKQRDSSFSDGSLDSDFNDEDDDNDDFYHNRSKMKEIEVLQKERFATPTILIILATKVTEETILVVMMILKRMVYIQGERDMEMPRKEEEIGSGMLIILVRKMPQGTLLLMMMTRVMIGKSLDQREGVEVTTSVKEQEVFRMELA
ncbi:hypothetical protein HPP92_001671 [Vanilla planifolia]|uniref:RanBP2-type domain-containing protein n=1 Tax=Vanilla planifolia TaxID=51239 RepID=A0A835S500_VANPL|nr:hypothetical protein HPP92_001671 [Vanilla planifolia]